MAKRALSAWWDHKTNNSWILPSLIKCLSKMDSDDWDLTPPTTNVGESQHHWTNINTGIQLSLRTDKKRHTHTEKRNDTRKEKRHTVPKHNTLMPRLCTFEVYEVHNF